MNHSMARALNPVIIAAVVSIMLTAAFFTAVGLRTHNNSAASSVVCSGMGWQGISCDSTGNASIASASVTE